MPVERARNYIERLPEIIEREEKDVSHLDPDMLEILYPERASKEFTVTLVFGPPPDGAADTYDNAVMLARKGRGYRTEGRDRHLRHHATFGIDEVQVLHALFSLVGEYPSCEVRVKGKRVPYARELWLPLFWFFKKDDDSGAASG